MSKASRRKRREIRYLQSEAAWIQKAMFALQKAETAHGKFVDTRDEEMGEYEFKVNGGSMTLEELDEAMDDRVRELREMTKERRKVLR